MWSKTVMCGLGLMLIAFAGGCVRAPEESADSVSGTQLTPHGSEAYATLPMSEMSQTIASLELPDWPNAQSFFETGYGPIQSRPAIEDSLIYFGSHDRRIYAVDVMTGQLAWSYETQLAVSASPVVADGILYSESWDGNLYALDSMSGRELWKFSASKDGSHAFTEVTVSGGRAYVGGSNRFYALDASSGQVLWEIVAKGTAITTPVVENDTIYFATYKPKQAQLGLLYALDADSGKEKWRFPFGGRPVGTIAGSNYLYIASEEGIIYAVDLATGGESWRKKVGSHISGDILLAGDCVYTIAEDENGMLSFQALAASDGGALWSTPIDAIISTAPTIAGDRAYFVATELVPEGSTQRSTGVLYAVDVRTGDLVSNKAVVNNTTSAPIVADGVIYFGGADGRLYRVKQP